MERIETYRRQLHSQWRDVRHALGAFYWRLRGYKDEGGGAGVTATLRPKPPVSPLRGARQLPK